MPHFDSTAFPIIGAICVGLIALVRGSIIARNNRQRAERAVAGPDVNVKGRPGFFDTSDPVNYLIIGIICAICGTVMACVLNYEQRMALTSVNWPITDGQITRSQRGFGKTHRFWELAQINYSYNVNGQKYNNNRIAFNDTWVQGHCNAPKEFPIAAIVKIHYSPNDPACSYLEIGNISIFGQRLYFAILFFINAAIMIFISVNGFQKRRQINNNNLVQK